MYFTTIVLTAILFCVVGSFFSVTKAESPLVCQGVEVKLPRSVKEHVISCLNNQGVKTPEDLPDDRKACYGKCLFSRSDVLGKNGIPDDEKYPGVIYSTFPEEISALYVEAVRKCTNDFGYQIRTLEADCESYQQISRCIVDSYTILCTDKGTTSALSVETI